MSAYYYVWHDEGECDNKTADLEEAKRWRDEFLASGRASCITDVDGNQVDPPEPVICFAVYRPDGNVDAVAITDEGKFLSAQTSSDPIWAARDLMRRSDGREFHHWFYRAALGHNYECVCYDAPPENWDGQRTHTVDSVKPWHMDPANESTLYGAIKRAHKARRVVTGESTATPDRRKNGEVVEP